MSKPSIPEINNSYALIIGIDEYNPPHQQLAAAVNDATELAKILENKFGYKITLLLNQDASKDRIIEKLTSLLDNTIEEDDRFLF